MKTAIRSFYLVLPILLLGLFTSCDTIIAGDGELMKEDRQVGNFESIRVSGAFKVLLSQGDVPGVTIETDKNVNQYVSTQVRDKTLYIETQGISLRNPTLNAYITVRDIEDIKISGAVELRGQTPIEAKRLSLSSSGAAKIIMDIYSERLYIDVSGAGKLSLEGEVEKVVVDITGAGEMDAKALLSRMLEIKISGAGKAVVNVQDEIEARISGAGSIRYVGDPKVYSRISGAGTIYPVN